MRRQDTAIKTDPYSATLRLHGARHDYYTVQSASDPDTTYDVALSVDDDPNVPDRCSCLATGPCWHQWAARTRRDCDRVHNNCAAMYREYTLPQMIAQERYLADLLAEADSWLVRAQLGAAGDRIAELLAASAAA